MQLSSLTGVSVIVGYLFNGQSPNLFIASHGENGSRPQWPLYATNQVIILKDSNSISSLSLSFYILQLGTGILHATPMIICPPHSQALPK